MKTKAYTDKAYFGSRISMSQTLILFSLSLQLLLIMLILVEELQKKMNIGLSIGFAHSFRLFNSFIYHLHIIGHLVLLSIGYRALYLSSCKDQWLKNNGSWIKLTLTFSMTMKKCTVNEPRKIQKTSLTECFMERTVDWSRSQQISLWWKILIKN